MKMLKIPSVTIAAHEARGPPPMGVATGMRELQDVARLDDALGQALGARGARSRLETFSEAGLAGPVS